MKKTKLKVYAAPKVEIVEIATAVAAPSTLATMATTGRVRLADPHPHQARATHGHLASIRAIAPWAISTASWDNLSDLCELRVRNNLYSDVHGLGTKTTGQACIAPSPDNYFADIKKQRVIKSVFGKLLFIQHST